MTFPGNYSRIWVRGRIIDLGKAARSEANIGINKDVVFAPSPTVILSGYAKQIIGTAPFSIKPDAQTGYFAIQLPATNDPDINPTAWTYAVAEPTGRKYNIVVPWDTPVLDSPGDPLDGQQVLELIDVVPAPAPQSGFIQLLPTGGDGGDVDAAITAHVAATDPHGDRAYTDTEVATRAALVHSHAIANVTGLQTALDAKQASDADLTTIAALDSATAGVMSTDGAGWIRKTYVQLKTALGLVKADVGLGSVDNTADASKPVSTAQQAALDLKAPLASPAFTGTPTGITKTHVGLGLVDNTADTAKPVSTAQQTALNLKENTANKGVTNGYAGLDGTGKVPAAQLPAFVDDVLEAANLAAFPATGSTGIIYVALDTNKTYRWSGSAYVEISPSPGSTDAVPEGSTNKYYTAARVAAEPVTTATQAALDLKAGLTHSHAISDVTGLQAALDAGGLIMTWNSTTLNYDPSAYRTVTTRPRIFVGPKDFRDIGTITQNPNPYMDLWLNTGALETSMSVTVGESTFDRNQAAAGAIACTSGQMRIGRFQAQRDGTWSNLRALSGAAAASGLTIARIGIWGLSISDGVTWSLVGSCANDTTLFAATARPYDVAAVAAFSLVAGRWYAGGVLQVGTTPANLTGQTWPGAMSSNFGPGPELGVDPWMAGTISSLANIPSTFLTSDVTPTTSRPYIRMY